jgi:hypothetical protein
MAVTTSCHSPLLQVDIRPAAGVVVDIDAADAWDLNMLVLIPK